MAPVMPKKVLGYGALPLRRPLTNTCKAIHASPEAAAAPAASAASEGAAESEHAAAAAGNVLATPAVRRVAIENNEYAINMRNIVSSFQMPLHIDLRKFVLRSANISLERGRGVAIKENRSPPCHMRIHASGKISIVGCKSEADARLAARRVAREVQKAMDKQNEVVRIRNHRVCNVLATSKMPFGIRIEEVARAYPAEAEYEPELCLGLIWRSKEPKATLTIHTTGSLTVTGAQSEADVYAAIRSVYPILHKYKCPPRAKDEMSAAPKRKPEMAAIKSDASRFIPRSKMSRLESGVVDGRVFFSDEEDYDDEDL